MKLTISTFCLLIATATLIKSADQATSAVKPATYEIRVQNNNPRESNITLRFWLAKFDQANNRPIRDLTRRMYAIRATTTITRVSLTSPDEALTMVSESPSGKQIKRFAFLFDASQSGELGKEIHIDSLNCALTVTPIKS